MQPLRNLVQHARTGTEALAVVFGKAEADEDGIDGSTVLREPPEHPFVDPGEVFEGEVAPADSRLVGRDDDAVAGPAQPCDRIETSGDRLPVFRGTHVARERLVDDTVPIENDEVQQPAPAGNAMRMLDGPILPIPFGYGEATLQIAGGDK